MRSFPETDIDPDSFIIFYIGQLLKKSIHIPWKVTENSKAVGGVKSKRFEGKRKA